MKWRLYKEKLLWLRISQGWSQEEAAHHCHAPDKKTYHLWETGKIERPHARNLQKIIDGFQLASIDDIIIKPIDRPAPELQALYQNHFFPASHIKTVVEDAAESQPAFKLVCFDMDATLIHGLEFSTRAIWDALGKDELLRKQGLRSYYTGKFTYDEWCLWVTAIFKQKGLTLEIFQKIIKQYYLAPHLREGLSELKRHGFKLAIVSNGLGRFLDELLPDWNHYLDYFYVNRLVFSDEGTLLSVLPSPFSIDQKLEAIRQICIKESLQMQEVVFVGSSFVNRQVAFNVGLTIGYADTSREISDLFDVVVKDDDFRSVVRVITGEQTGNGAK